MAIHNENKAETTDHMLGRDLNSLIEDLLNFVGEDTEEYVQFNSESSSQTSLQQISTRGAVNDISPNRIISSDQTNFGLVDSLTFVHCKRLSIEMDEEKVDDEFEVIDFYLVEPKRMIEQHHRTGIRRGQQAATYDVPTKK
eukprot:CCRYP_011863-RA/>CCRYP_011863-RA protein AED:0.31 eAED:0.31 QI:0/-1/0/1/-1/1/1/0/140